MKVALVLTGHMRGYEEAYKTFKEHLIDKVDVCDVYISTWSDRGWYTGKGYKKPRPDGFINLEDDDKGYVPGEPVDFTEVSKLYHPYLRSTEIEEFSGGIERIINERKGYFKNAFTRPANTISQFRKIACGVNLVVHATSSISYNIRSYDLIVRTRPDLILQGALPDISSLDPNVFYHNPGSNSVGRGIGDQFHISGLRNMFAFKQIYEHLERLYDYIGYSCPHVYCEEFLKSQKIPYQMINTPMKLWHSPSGVPYTETDGTVYKSEV